MVSSGSLSKLSCAFVTDHDEAYRKLTGHKINLPNQVQGLAPFEKSRTHEGAEDRW